MKWMENVNNPNVEGKTYIQDSTGMGWYEDNSGDNPQKTGTDIGNKGSNQVKKIYDLAGNVGEWTMESYYNETRVDRGGTYGHTGSDSPASRRDYKAPSFSNSYYGFRPTLFLNS